MKKIFLAASLLCLITAGVNAHPGPGKTSKKGTVAKTVISPTAPGDTTHHKKTAMSSKKHHKTATAAQAKAK